LSKTFSERIIDVIKNISHGQILSYKEVSELAGHPNGARQVARILKTSTDKHNLPWWRVINSKMEVSIKDPIGRQMQIDLLKSEGHIVIDGKVKANFK
jgi:methylated-DNA-protein-cysteine methyltransferase-like protein